MSMTRRRLLDDTFKKTVVGNPAIAIDSLARMYPDITMQGWTEQKSTTGAQLFDYQNVQNMITGASGNRRNGEEISGLPAGQYTISSRQKTIGTMCYLYANVKTASGEFGSAIYIVTNSNIITQTMTINNGDSIIIYDAQNHNLELSKSLFEEYGIMLNAGSTALPWEPYTGGTPSPSPDYPQEIVSAGNWNEEAQKWEYEITIANAQTDPDKNQSVTLTADRPLTKWDRLEKRNGQWGWVYKSAEIESYTDESVPGEYYSTTGQLSAGAQVWYETATETFAPLTTTEQEAMNALHTYRPTTVLSNQQDCEMALTYKTRKSMEVTT